MAHPKMFEDDDPLLARVRRIALALPGAQEKIGHGRPTFYTTKVFAYYGGSRRVDGEWVRHDTAVLVKPDEPERLSLLGQPGVFVPAYLGPSGWLGLDLDPDADPDEAADWQEIAELIETSFRNTAPVKRIRELDAVQQRPGG